MSTDYGNGYRGYVDPNFPNPMGDGDSAIIIYGYTPSLALGILGAVLFALALLIHLVLTIMYKKLWFGVPILVGCVFEIVGYIMRSLSARVDPYMVSYYVVQYFFIVVAPVLFSAAVYGVISALIRQLGRAYSPLISPRAILAIFITADVVSTVIQVVGAALIGVSESNRKDPTTANNILLAGLAIQVFSFLVFLVLLFAFFWRARRWLATGKTGGSEAKETTRRQAWYAAGFVAATLLIYLRTTYRLAETSKGLFSDLQTKEVYFGTLEFMPVILAVWILSAVHPARWVGK